MEILIYPAIGLGVGLVLAFVLVYMTFRDKDASYKESDREKTAILISGMILLSLIAWPFYLFVIALMLIFVGVTYVVKCCLPPAK